MTSDQNYACEQRSNGEPPLRQVRFPSPRRRFDSRAGMPTEALQPLYDGEEPDAFQLPSISEGERQS